MLYTVWLIVLGGLAYTINQFINQIASKRSFVTSKDFDNFQPSPFMLFCASTFGPPLEELLFRGPILLMLKFREHTFLDDVLVLLVLLITSALFGLLHVSDEHTRVAEEYFLECAAVSGGLQL